MCSLWKCILYVFLFGSLIISCKVQLHFLSVFFLILLVFIVWKIDSISNWLDTVHGRANSQKFKVVVTQCLDWSHFPIVNWSEEKKKVQLGKWQHVSSLTWKEFTQLMLKVAVVHSFAWAVLAACEQYCKSGYSFPVYAVGRYVRGSVHFNKQTCQSGSHILHKWSSLCV